jgi:hypothetical protein
MMKRNSQSDDNGNDIAAVGRLCALAGQLTVDPGDLAGIATASDSPTISAPGLPWSWAVTGLPTTARLPWSGAVTGLPTTAGLLLSGAAAGLPRFRLRRTNHGTPAAAAGSSPTATSRARDGVDARLLELGGPLGVGAGPLPSPTLPSRRLGCGPLAPTGWELGLGSGTLAALGSARAWWRHERALAGDARS